MDFNFDIEDRGIHYPESGRVLINPSKHESLQELLDTMDHEMLHPALDEFDLDEVQQHWVIKKIAWIDEFLKL